MTYINTAYGTLEMDEQKDSWTVHSLLKQGFQIADIELALEWITRESVVVDVGAHVGLFTIAFAKKAKQVFSFEPNDTVRVLLEKNLAANGATGMVTVLPFVATDTPKQFVKHAINDQQAEMQYVATAVVGGESIAGKPLDEVIEKADFIKIDVEGMEPVVLRGASVLIDRSRPVIFIEINKKALDAQGNSRSEIGKFFTKKKYRLYRIDEGKLHRIFSPVQSTFTNLLAVPREKQVAATNPFVYIFHQLKRRIASLI